MPLNQPYNPLDPTGILAPQQQTAGMTPQQINEAIQEALRGEQAGRQQENKMPLLSWTQVVGGILEGMSNRNRTNQLLQAQKQQYQQGAKNVPDLNDTGGSSSPSPAPSAPARPSASVNPTGSSAGPSSTGGDAPPSSAMHAAMRTSSMGETSGQFGMKALTNISPDTGGSEGYGPWQLNSKTGSAAAFAKRYPELGLTAQPGTPEWRAQWHNAALNNTDAMLRAHESWYRDKYWHPVADTLTKAGFDPKIANDPRVQAYMADRKLQMDTVGQGHALAAARGAQTPEQFIHLVSQADSANVGNNFRSYLSTYPDRVRGLQNRINARAQASLGIRPDTAPASASPSPAPAVSAPGAAPGGAMAFTGEPTPTNPLAGVNKPPSPQAALTPPSASVLPGPAQPPAAPGSFADRWGNMPSGPAAPSGAAQAVVNALGGGAGQPVAPTPFNRTGPRSLAASGTPPIPAPGAAPKSPSAAPPAVPTGGRPDPEPAPVAPTAPSAPVSHGTKVAEPLRAPMDQIRNLIADPTTRDKGWEMYNDWQKRLQPQVTFEKMKSGDTEYDVVRTFDPKTGYASVQMMAPGGGRGGTLEELQNAEIQRKAREKSVIESAGELAKGRAKPVTEAIERGMTAQKEVQLLQTLKLLSGQTPQALSGPLASTFVETGKALKEVTNGALGWDTASAEAVDKINSALASLTTREITNRPALAEFANQIKSNPGLANSKEGRELLIDIMVQATQQDVGLSAKAEKFRDVEGGPAWSEVRDKHYKDNPVRVTYHGKTYAADEEGLAQFKKDTEAVKPSGDAEWKELGGGVRIREKR